MITLADYNFNKISLLDAVLELSKQLRSEFPLEAVKTELALLVKESRRIVAADLPEDQQLDQLLKLFYRRWRFGKEADSNYRFSDTLWLDSVLQTRQGSSFSLGAILLYLAHELKLPLVPVCFPTQLILRADWMDGEMWLIDPMSGNKLDEPTLEGWLKGDIGEMEQLLDEDLDEAENELLVHNFLLMLKSAYMREDEYEKALAVNAIILSFDPGDPYEIRDRGLLYAQLDCNHIALSDLTYFISKCPDDPVAEVIRGQISEIKNRPITLH